MIFLQWCPNTEIIGSCQNSQLGDPFLHVSIESGVNHGQPQRDSDRRWFQVKGKIQKGKNQLIAGIVELALFQQGLLEMEQVAHNSELICLSKNPLKKMIQ